MRNNLILVLMIFGFNLSSSFSQNGLGKLLTKESEKVEKIYVNSGYMDYVDKTMKKEALDNESLAKIANSYRMNSKTFQAEVWYAKFIHRNEKPIHFLHYAQVLQSNRKCQEAVTWFEKYQESSEDENVSQREFVKNCKELDAIKEVYGITLENLEEINTKHLDFSAIPLNDEVIFTSTRGTASLGTTKDLWTNDNFSDLFTCKINEDGELGNPKPLLGKVNAKFHDGTATFNRGKNVMYFTRNDIRKRKNSEKVNLKIYVSIFGEDGWTNPVELPFNSEKFNTCHPTLSSDEKFIYFSSSRPGGFGGMDLYVSEMIEGEWTTPINLGPNVNSPDNELFPFIKEDGTLYFASNGHLGLGGLDLYKTSKDQKQWNKVENIGKPFNSSADDFGFWTNSSDTNGFLSSNRTGGKGGDDIYTWNRDENIMSKTICVFDNNTNQPITNAKVTIIETPDVASVETNNELYLALKPTKSDENEYLLTLKDSDKGKVKKENKTVVTTNELGILEYPIKKDHTYNIVIEKKGFSSFTQILDFTALMDGDCFPLESRDCEAMVFSVLEKASNAQMPMAQITINDNKLNTKKKYALDENGKLSICLQKKHQYTIEAAHVGYLGSNQTLTVKDGPTPNGEVVLYVSLPEGQSFPSSNHTTGDVAHHPNHPNNQGLYYPTNAMNSPPFIDKINQLYEYFLGSKDANFKLDQVIELKDIYYDYDKYNIRPEAAYSLEKVVELLVLFPSMEISLRSHTDSRGSTNYNSKLSRNRAIEARNYIISKGIASHRVTYENFGESQIRNHCANDVNCSDQDHEYNRRTEIKVTRLDNPNVRIKHQH